MKTLHVKKGLLKYFKKFLDGKLSGKECRIRSRFLQKLFPFIQELEDTRIALCENFCDRKESGEPSMVGGNYTFSAHFKEFNEEYAKLFNETVSIEIEDDDLESIKKMLKGKEEKTEFDVEEYESYNEINKCLYENTDV
ncbi:MAG: hypothetical protein KGN01_06525 [Patescibacteria group bacterium]|nr:hypothetical protein [Patescibacteria group bacterium]